MKRWIGIAAVAAAGFLSFTAIRAQPAPASLPGFEVATIKPGTPERGFGVQIQGRRLTTVNTSVAEIMAFAWSLHPRQITGGPAWMETEKYDLLAETGPAIGDAPRPDIRAMVQKLLADRFGLQYHRGTKELSVYQIVVGKTGPKLADKAGDPNANPTFGISALGTMQVNNGKISDFAGWMQRYVLDRPVVDHTGVTGRFTFTLNWAADDSQFGSLAGTLRPPAGNADRPDLYEAVQQQLGLKLEATKAPVEVLIVDHVEKPSEN
jgi:uncharacterized protein (TIGR03435 family)